MSFFGFDSTLPRDRQHNQKAPGFGPTPDVFAGLSRGAAADEDDGLDFEDTYDGLGDVLDESQDALNADTFGLRGGASVGKDFDFSGQTSKMMDTMQDEHALYDARQPAPRASPPKPAVAAPARSGYERYKQPDYIPNLEASASIWGNSVKTAKPTTPQPQQYQQQPQPHRGHVPSLSMATRKMMSLEEVEASMRNAKKPSASPQPPTQPSATAQPPFQMAQQLSGPQYHQPSNFPPQETLQRPQQPQMPMAMRQQQRPATDVPQVPQTFHEDHPSVQQLHHTRQALQQGPKSQQGFQGPSGVPHGQLPPASHAAQMHRRGPSYGGRVITNPQQIMDLSEEDRAAYLAEDARRAKRNHKIHLLSKDNGLMTPHDKNFITRIQLQQLVSATAGLDELAPDAALAEDFYYQVYSQIRGAPRQDPNQPLNHFAQTYLNQTAGRTGRRYAQGGQGQMRRMEQQVQRAVEAAKARPKNKQLVMEGSLGKISFSNAKTPKPLLNLKRLESQDVRPATGHKMRAADIVAGRMGTLRDIESVYMTLMKMEDHERRMPPPPREESSGDEIQAHMDWTKRLGDLNQILWSELKVMEPIDPNFAISHPFMAILSHPKGKKLMPRVFRQIDEQQRVTILTMIVVHLDMLDVIRDAVPHANETQLPRFIRDQVDLFSHAVLPSLFNYVNDAQLGIIIGLVGLIMDRVNIQNVVRTRIGLGLLTIFISRAELVKQAGDANDSDWEQWTKTYNRLFDMLEPLMGLIFPNTINSGEDMYVWQFLAALGVEASPDQQQRLVLAVKDRVMDTVSHAKTLPDDIGRPRLDNVNLFMRAIGLDVDLLG